MKAEEITKLAEELAKDWIEGNNLPNCLGNEVLSGMAKEMERVIRFILRTHCIVSKEKVREAYNNANQGDVFDRFENGYNLGVVETIKSLFDPNIFDETDK